LADCAVTLRDDAARDAFASWSRGWLAEEAQHEERFSVDRCALLSATTVSVNWTARWLPPTVLPLVRLCRRLGLRVSLTDLRPLAGKRSSFSWASLLGKLAGAARTGSIELPEATVSGRSVLTYDDARRVVALEESLDLGPELRAGRVLNRRCARDVADFCAQWRRPPTASAREWDDELREALALRDVPGMGAFDVDGLEAEQLSQRLEASALLMGLAAVGTIAFGIGAAQLRARQVREMRPAGNEPADAEDAGSRMRSRRLLRGSHGSRG
jgi:hypothetical protein